MTHPNMTRAKVTHSDKPFHLTDGDGARAGRSGRFKHRLFLVSILVGVTIGLLHLTLAGMQWGQSTFGAALDSTADLALLNSEDFFSIDGNVLVAVLASFVLLALMLAYGLMSRKRWAWTGTLVVQVFGTVVSMIGLVGGHGLGLNVMRLAIAAVVTGYLMQPDVRRAFGR